MLMNGQSRSQFLFLLPPPVLLQLPGFLELIVEYYRRCLIQIFGILEEYEVGAGSQRTLPEKEEVLKELAGASSESNVRSAEQQRIQRRSVEEMEEMPPLLTAAPNINSMEEVKDSIPVVREEVEVKKEHQEQAEPRPQQASKYDKLPVKVEERGEQWQEMEERWAELNRPNGFISGLLHWKAGGGDSTAHIQTHFEAHTGDFTPPNPAEREEREGGGEGRREEAEKNLPAGEETPPETQQGKDLEEGEVLSTKHDVSSRR